MKQVANCWPILEWSRNPLLPITESQASRQWSHRPGRVTWGEVPLCPKVLGGLKQPSTWSYSDSYRLHFLNIWNKPNKHYVTMKLYRFNKLKTQHMILPKILPKQLLEELSYFCPRRRLSPQVVRNSGFATVFLHRWEPCSAQTETLGSSGGYYDALCPGRFRKKSGCSLFFTDFFLGGNLYELEK